MSHKFLNRSDAPFSEKVWDLIDSTVAESGRSVATVRRIVHTEAPRGFDLRSLPGPESEVAKESNEDISVSVSPSTPVVAVQSQFSLGARDIQGYEESGITFDVSGISRAAKRCIEKEDQILLNGSIAAGVPGLTNTEGVHSSKLGEWKEPGIAAEDLMKAVDKLDSAGFHGPYALALTPSLYNHLFRKYPNSPTLEIDHLRALVTEGIVKAPALKKGGLLIASGKWNVSVVLGQDLMAGFDGPEGRVYEFTLSESIGLRIQEPESVCVLN